MKKAIRSTGRSKITRKKQQVSEKTDFDVRYGQDAAGTRYLEISSEGGVAIIPAADMLLPQRQLADVLLRQGIQALSRSRLAALQKAFEGIDPNPVFKIVTQAGWIGRTAFAHGATLVGTLPSGVVFKPELIDLGDRPGKFSVGGSARAWRRFALRFGKDQPLVTFLLCLGFASMILGDLKVQPLVVLLYGKSSLGKTTLAVFVGSIFGGDPARDLRFAESFKATDVGIQKIFLAHNCVLLILDELNRIRGSDGHRLEILEATVTDFCSGVPKTTATSRVGGLQWSGCGLITSNDDYPKLLAKADAEPAENMGPRLFEVSADIGTGLGIFKQLPPGFKSSLEAIKAMQAASAEHYGWAAREFAAKVAKARGDDEEKYAKYLKLWQRIVFKRLGPELTGVAGQVRDKLAGIVAVGMLAKRLGVLPEELKVLAAIDWVWRSFRTPKKEIRREPIRAVASYIFKNRQEFAKTPLPAGISEAAALRLPGLEHHGEDGLEFLIPIRPFRRKFKRHGGAKIVIPALLEKGLATAENAREHKFQVKRKIGPNLRPRFYCIKAKILRHSRVTS